MSSNKKAKCEVLECGALLEKDDIFAHMEGVHGLPGLVKDLQSKNITHQTLVKGT